MDRRGPSFLELLPNVPIIADELPPPIIQEEDAASRDVFVCSLCLEIPTTDPYILHPCDHIFCHRCLVRAQETRSDCPNCRTLPTSTAPLQGALRRIWERIPVACAAKNCTWKGCLGSYASHTQRCGALSVIQSKLMQIFTEAFQEAWEVERLKLEHDVTQRVEQQQRLRAARTAMTPLDRFYGYDRFRVVELTQLICQHLEDKPPDIDRNRIFNCVKHIYDAYRGDWPDNPPHLYVNLRMLLNVCRATAGWFTHRQMNKFHTWCCTCDFT